MPNNSLVILLLLLPILGFVIEAFLGKQIVKSSGESGKRLLGAVAVLVVVGSFAAAVKLAIDLAGNDPSMRSQMVTLAPWINLAGLKVPFEFLIDPLSITMALIVTGVGALIHLYATGYMVKDKDYSRFFTYMNLFIFSMLVLVTAGNLVVMFIGWEGVGLCSYLLIGFWYSDHANAKAANKAFIVTRIGDVGFMLGIFMLFTLIIGQVGSGASDGRTLSFDNLIDTLPGVMHSHPSVAVIIALLFFLAAVGKSAQFPLYFWLPDAMAGPTPVSALIHAATMVTSGVFLLNRLYLIYEAAPIAAAVVTIIGAFTAIFAALIAFSQTDIKKVLAYSTVSQVGYMFVACGAGGFSAGIFHLATHAFFKALLFLGAGAVIHSMAHNQDMRNYGKLAKYLPITAITMFIAFLAISGIPFFAGYYSKEAIFSASVGGSFAKIGSVNFGQIAGYVAIFTAFLTAIYMARLTWLTFFGREERWRLIEPHHDSVQLAGALPECVSYSDDPNGWYKAIEPESNATEPEHTLDKDHEPHEVGASMWIPMVILAVLSVVGGYALDAGRLEAWLYPVAPSSVPKLAEVPWVTPVGIAAAVLGALVGGFYYWKGLPANEGWNMSKWNPLRIFALNQFGFNSIVSDGSSEAGKEIGAALNVGVDKGIIEGILGGLALCSTGIGDLLKKLQSGYARSYALLMLAGAVVLTVWIAVVGYRGGF